MAQATPAEKIELWQALIRAVLARTLLLPTVMALAELCAHIQTAVVAGQSLFAAASMPTEAAGSAAEGDSGARQRAAHTAVLESMLRACEKRQVSLEQVEEAVDGIEQRLMSSYEREVPSSLIGEMAMESLRSIDEAAFVRFASVYRQFRDIKSFIEELSKLL